METIKKIFSKVFATVAIIGVFVAVCMGLVILKHQRNQREYDSLHLIGEEKRH